jgi:hypothetical protein
VHYTRTLHGLLHVSLLRFARPSIELAEKITHLICTREVTDSNPYQALTKSTERVRVFPQSPQANAAMVPDVRQLPLNSTFSLVHYSLSILRFDNMHCEI